MLVLVAGFNRRFNRASLATATGLLDDVFCRKVAPACVLVPFSWFLTPSRRPVSRANGRDARGHGAGTGFPRERVRRPLRGDRPHPRRTARNPVPTPPSRRAAHRRRWLTLRPNALTTPPHVAFPYHSPRRRPSRRFASSLPRSSRATARTTGSSSSPCSSAPRSSCTDTISRRANGKARGAWRSPGAFDER